MSDLIPVRHPSVQALLDNIRSYKYNPTRLIAEGFDYLDAMMAGEVDIVDPTNPMVYLLGVSAAMTSIAVEETMASLSPQYPELANNYQDLYLHMSDIDYIGRFATPAPCRFIFYIHLDDLLTKMVESPTEGCKKASIARNTEFTVDQYTFTLQYPIDIRYYPNQAIEVRYNTEVISPVQSLSFILIPHIVQKRPDNSKWLVFYVDTLQCQIKSTEYPIQASTLFNETIELSHRYYYAQVFYKTNPTIKTWTKMKITHSDQVYDPRVPTAVLTVLETSVKVYIPDIYVTSGLVSGIIRIDIYETMGKVSLSMADFPLKMFNTRLTSVDEVNDTDEYTLVMSDVTFYSNSLDVVSGGTDGLNLEELRTQVVQNASGDPNLPITRVQLLAYGQNRYNGYTIVPDSDLITNRVFLALKDLNSPIIPGIIIPAAVSLGTTLLGPTEFDNHPEIIQHFNTVTIPSGLLFQNNNGVIELQDPNSITNMKSLPPQDLVTTMNTGSYLYNPFHYILDIQGDQYQSRPYYFDNPKTEYLSVVGNNSTLSLVVNTGSHSIERTAAGYRVSVLTHSDEFYKNLSDDFVSALLLFKPNGEKRYAGVLADLLTRTDNRERIFDFEIATTFDVTTNHNLILNNFKIYDTDLLELKSNLSHEFTIIYLTTSVTTSYVRSEIDDLVIDFLVPDGSVGITKETLQVTFGYNLERLWARRRLIPIGLDYETYPDDVPLTYTTGSFERDPNTGLAFEVIDNTITYHPYHPEGEPIVDELGNPLYSHLRGDPVLDDHGQPIPLGTLKSTNSLDLFFMDAGLLFVTDNNHLKHRQNVIDEVVGYVSKDLLAFSEKGLEQTQFFYTPKRTLGIVEILIGDDVTVQTTAEQSLTIDLYVTDTVTRDLELKTAIRESTVRIINDGLRKSTVSIHDLITDLKASYGDTVKAINIRGLGGEHNYPTITITNPINSLSLKRIIAINDSGNIVVSEDLAINFIKY